MIKKKNIIALFIAFGAILGLIQNAFSQPLPTEFRNPNTKAKVIMLEFSAPWCASCIKLKPELSALHKELGQKLEVHHLNIEEEATQKYIESFEIESVPTFILYDGQGKRLHKIQRDITPKELRSLIQGSMG